MRRRASFILAAVALAQVLLLGFSLGLLVFMLRDVRANLIRLESEEQSFLRNLGEAESDLYRTSILLRDIMILQGVQQEKVRDELADLLEEASRKPLAEPRWLSEEMRKELLAIEIDRKDYLERTRAMINWQDTDRRTLGPQYLARQLTPMRDKFVAATRKIAGIVRALRESRNKAMADSIPRIQRLVIRILAGAAVLGLALVLVAVWRFRRYEEEREVHLGELQQAEAGLRALSKRLVRSQELERKKLSRELHDEVGQILTALRVQLGQIHIADSESKPHMERAAELADRSLKAVREMARGLRPAMLDDLGLAAALQWLGRDFSKNTVLDVEVAIEGEFTDLDEARRTCLYRVVQEALTNCVKHSKSKSARVLLHESPGEIVLTVQDNGAGFKPGDRRGIGILGMRERVDELGGELAVVSSPGAGTLIRVNLPKTTIEEKA
jgi:signal transduction histidine kinase